MRRIIAIISAAALAVVGSLLLWNYVRAADERALAGVELQEVLVVAELIPANTAAENAANFVAVQKLPAIAVVPGALSDLAAVKGQVTTVDLEPGEQLLPSRFVDPASLEKPTRIDVPEGFQEVTIQLEAQRVLGGTLRAGDRVGIILSATVEDTAADTSADVTSNVLDQVLVTRVALTEQTTTEGGERAPQSLYVTFAVNTPQAETIVFGMEHANVWLTLQPEGPLEGTSEVVTPERILR